MSGVLPWLSTTLTAAWWLSSSWSDSPWSEKDAAWIGLLGKKPILLVSCLTSQLHASISQGRICSDKCMCCHSEIEAADRTFQLTQSQYTDTRPTSPSSDPITQGTWQGSHWNASFEVTCMTSPWQIPVQAGFEPRIFHSWGGRNQESCREITL